MAVFASVLNTAYIFKAKSLVFGHDFNYNLQAEF